jgi:hypothetical protein
MKLFIALTASALLLSTAPARAADLVSVAGPLFGWTGIDGIAEGWSIASEGRFSIAAHLGNGNGGPPATGNIAYLTRGALPSMADIVASTSFTLPGDYDGMFTLFADVTLSPGDYWLILFSPGPPDSYANWGAANPATITVAPRHRFLGYAISIDGWATFRGPYNNEYAYGLVIGDVRERPRPF